MHFCSFCRLQIFCFVRNMNTCPYYSLFTLNGFVAATTDSTLLVLWLKNCLLIAICFIISQCTLKKVFFNNENGSYMAIVLCDTFFCCLNYVRAKLWAFFFSRLFGYLKACKQMQKYLTNTVIFAIFTCVKLVPLETIVMEILCWHLMFFYVSWIIFFTLSFFLIWWLFSCFFGGLVVTFWIVESFTVL